MSGDEQTNETPPQSPFFRATETDRYARQEEIKHYESEAQRSLIVFWGPIESPVITPFEDAVRDVDEDTPLDLMLTSLGGDGETAIRMASMCHAARQDFRVIVPDTAASAATLLTLAAEKIVMSDTSTLGPVDPQVLLPARDRFFPAKGIIEIVSDLDERTRRNPQAFELYAALLADLDAVVLQTAMAAIRRTDELVPEVLRLRRPPPNHDEVELITKNLQSSAMHSATIGHSRASELGLPIAYMPSRSAEWDLLWRLHTHYAFKLGPHPRNNMIEGRRVSFRFGSA